MIHRVVSSYVHRSCIPRVTVFSAWSLRSYQPRLSISYFSSHLKTLTINFEAQKLDNSLRCLLFIQLILRIIVGNFLEIPVICLRR